MHFCPFIHSSIDGHTSFLILAIVNNATVNMGVQMSPWVFSFSSDKYLEVELLDPVVVLFLISWGTSILFSIVVAPVYIPTSDAQGFPFLHSLTNSGYFWSLWW